MWRGRGKQSHERDRLEGTTARWVTTAAWRVPKLPPFAWAHVSHGLMKRLCLKAGEQSTSTGSSIKYFRQ
eukprot:1538272-Rhodomonas_salina.1